ncbi:hypothetical protein NEOLEDRAFT_80797 [Neolentinus lepideus HHB14362 ss-1]|uniref:COQ9 C-terminal domain-containing protein n=1 Tax=Neolentinus lepideus HHB14362 ss-1 TaxID=1314782 RepID=A0A165N1A3_9AGAM|nr:hypothetical protein NEOLEDRAFT_80797 [Neolentinus lepideus HHB14362 ss-1]
MSPALQLLRHAFPLIPTHGFTRQTLALSVLHQPNPHTQPLSDTAINALFGEGENARRTLIEAWIDNARQHMGSKFIEEGAPRINDVLKARLEENAQVLQHLPEAFAFLASPQYGLPLLDPRPGMKHAFMVADEACRIVGDTTIGTAWYVHRGSLAAIYSAAELHQLTSPRTAPAFLDTLLNASSAAKSAVDDAETFATYIGRSWAGIIRGSGVF